MLPTFVIGLREGLEASLIVGIVAAFLRQQDRRDAMRWMWLGVGAAVALCAAAGVGLRIAEENLPQREQEQLETVIGLIAVGFITWMIVWMRRNAAGLKGELEAKADRALAESSSIALVMMAFLAVFREGLETAVFLLAAFQQSTRPSLTGTGAALGVLTAVLVGYAIYRGGLRINLQKFFKITGVLLVLVAAGLLAGAVHTGHEAGWVNVFQARALDLTWLVEPGSVQSALITGMFGIQPEPTVGEVFVWLAYAIPMTVYVLRPTRRRAPSRSAARVGVVAMVALALIVVPIVAAGAAVPRAKANTVKVTLTDDGCPAKLETPAGATTFKVTNKGDGAVSEFEVLTKSRIIGEVENIAPGLSGEFSLTLKPGDYTTKCPGGDKHATGALTVTGTADTKLTPAQQAVVDTYRGYLEAQTAELVSATNAFVAAVQSGNVELAKQLYGPARVPYERIEPVAETFGDLDPKIDARKGDVRDDEWGGFHKIEQALFVSNTTAGMSEVAADLQEDVGTLANLVASVELQPASIANGAVELLNEVSASKITGEEERYSRIDLLDFAGNVQGAKAAFDAVKPLLTGAKAALAAQIDARFAAVDTALAAHKVGTGYVLYTALTSADTRALSQAIDALAEPLSKVAKQIVKQ